MGAVNLSFGTQPNIVLLEATVRIWAHRGNEGMFTGSSRTQAGCGVSVILSWFMVG